MSFSEKASPEGGLPAALPTASPAPNEKEAPTIREELRPRQFHASARRRTMLTPKVEALIFKEAEEAQKAAKEQAMQYEKLENFLAPMQKGLLGRKMSTSKMLSWTKESLCKPMTAMDVSLEKVALKCFREIQRIMGDRANGIFGAKSLNREQRFASMQFLVSQALQSDALRDELYMQLMKQLCKNPRLASNIRGFEVMAVMGSIVAPQNELSKHVIAFLDRHCTASEGVSDSSDEAKLKKLAGYAKRKLEQLHKLPPRRQVPKIREIEHIATIAPYRNNVFGETLEDIIKAKENVDDTGFFPRVLSFLAEAVILLKGCETQGIFRVPGDVDQVIDLKLRIEQGKYNLDGIDDPAVPASLLKQWFRELIDPVIPNAFYERCLNVGDDVDAAMDILDELPSINRQVIKFLVKYLQVVGDSSHQQRTKMTISNLSMVFAPNLLRCPSDNPLIILANQKAEHNFLKILVNYLEE